ncbi:acyltransferase family protein [Massilia glaciei]|nr:acyltransferase [Massilia glaciei]
MKRIDSLDWQRGLLALSIMVYHLFSWQVASLDSSTLLGRLGIYGVSMFFILSGLSMAVVYNAYIVDIQSSLNFFVRRIFRIWPLLWLTIFCAVLYKFVSGQPSDWLLVASNLTTLFGFFQPSAYISTGAWSIGNEMVYYALTPLIIYVYNRKLLLGNLLTAATWLVGLLFSSYILNSDRTLVQQWATYVNPFNNLYFYSAGIAIFYNMRQLALGKTASVCLLVLPALLFFAFPVVGDPINIVTGTTRVVFSLASLLMVIGFYKMALSVPGMIARPLTQLGVLTYGVYLLHPIVYRVQFEILKHLGITINSFFFIVAAIFLTIIAAQIAFTVLEMPFIRLGKSLTTTRKSEKPVASAAVQK